MSILLGSLAGLLLGEITWVIAGSFIEHYQGVARTTTRLFAGLRRSIVPLAVMAAWGAFVGWRDPGLSRAASALLTTALLLAISLIDFRTRRIPNPLVAALLAWAVVQAIAFGQPAPAAAGLGLLVGLGFFLLLALLGRGAMGFGDVKLAAALGALLGYPQVLAGLFLGIVAGGLAALLLLLTGRAGRKDTMAYGPYLALGAWVVLGQVWGMW